MGNTNKEMGTMFKVVVVFVLSAFTGITVACLGSYWEMPFVGPVNSTEDILHTGISATLVVNAMFYLLKFYRWLWWNCCSPSTEYYASSQGESL